ncbi:MAG: putative cytochrome biosis protein transrane region [Haloplasmataceae bacterium]|jgi:hypothetical protein|nr:putative cytochrome biosis protein transrane region [Haloplasmataceae bacterium]
MKKGILTTLIIFTMLFLNLNLTANAESESDKEVIYFYVTLCSTCNKTTPYVDTLEKYDIKVTKFDFTKNGELFYQYVETYNVPLEKRSTPMLFVGGTYFHGEDIIPNIKDYTIHGLASEEFKDLKDSNMNNFSIFALIYFALIDGVNPCAMAMLLLFISLLGFTSKRSILINVSLTYIFALFISYFLLGTVLFNVLHLFKGSIFILYFNILIIVLSLVLFIYNMYDYYVSKNEKYEKIKVQLPKVIHKYNKKIMKIFTKKLEEDSPLIYIITFALGFIISLTEFLCTGQVYLAFITSMIHFSESFDIRSVLYLLLYNFVFVLPLIAVAVIAIVSKSIMGTSDFIRKRMHIIKLLNATLFLVIALYYLNYYFDFIDLIIHLIGLGWFITTIVLIIVIFILVNLIMDKRIKHKDGEDE